MEASKSKSNRKRPRENESVPLRRSQRLLAKGQRLPDKPQQFRAKRQRLDTPEFHTKITDLIDDCLEKIFGYLDVHSLFNMIVANGWLRQAAATVYKRKFDTRAGYISGRCYRFGRFYHRNFKTCLQYIRCLGSSIRFLEIWYDDLKDEECEQIHHYVNEYCAESLVEIELINKPNRISIDHFEKPFVNVHTVEVHRCDLGDQLPQFQHWFPNMHTLTLTLAKVHTICQAETPLNNLQILRIYVDSVIYGSGDSTLKNVTHFLKLCPQIQCLNIEINDYDNELSLKQLLNIMKDNRELRKLKIEIGERCEPWWNVELPDIEQLVEQEPLLVELELPDLRNYPYSASDVISVVSQLNSLKVLRFEIDSRLGYDQLVAQLDSQWQPSYEYDIVTLQR